MKEEANNDREMKKDSERYKESKEDMFSWLKVPSRFKILKKMIRERLIEIIGEVTTTKILDFSKFFNFFSSKS